jgi:hypothetical protein
MEEENLYKGASKALIEYVKGFEGKNTAYIYMYNI